jgi:hypothetical protein
MAAGVLAGNPSTMTINPIIVESESHLPINRRFTAWPIYTQENQNCRVLSQRTCCSSTWSICRTKCELYGKKPSVSLGIIMSGHTHLLRDLHLLALLNLLILAPVLAHILALLVTSVATPVATTVAALADDNGGALGGCTRRDIVGSEIAAFTLSICWTIANTLRISCQCADR